MKMNCANVNPKQKWNENKKKKIDDDDDDEEQLKFCVIAIMLMRLHR